MLRKLPRITTALSWATKSLATALGDTAGCSVPFRSVVVLTSRLGTNICDYINYTSGLDQRPGAPIPMPVGCLARPS